MMENSVIKNNRDYINDSILLCAESEGKKYFRHFNIVKKISEGASIICYEAYHSKSGRGTLKEFYPIDALDLYRDENGQLRHSKGYPASYEDFQNRKNKYLKSYEILLEKKQSDSKSDLATFIPSFEIYNGCDKDGNIIGTVYIWTPEPLLVSYESICDDIHKNSNILPEHKLVTVLSAMESLTVCVQELHKAELIHRDIKPSNIGFIKRKNETLTQTLSMFDIDSICSVYEEEDIIVGTPGFMEPRNKYKGVNNKTDIYSIGATLFYSIIVTEETKERGFHYYNEYFSRIPELIRQSTLIKSSDSNSHPRIIDTLTRILEKSLCDRKNRYSCCEELLEDIKEALFFALPSDIARGAKNGKKWVLEDVKDAFDSMKGKDPLRMIQNHLYCEPLYKYVRDDDTEINVLIVGLGYYGQMFLNECLQIGQMRNKHLKIVAVSDDEEDERIYFSSRPLMHEFFNINNSGDHSKELYGDIITGTEIFERTKDKKNIRKIKNIISNYFIENNPEYVFVALGDDDFNYEISKLFYSVLEDKCSINCICEGVSDHKKSNDSINKIYVNSDLKKEHNYFDIERMALNTHLMWEKYQNIDYGRIKKRFNKKYNHNASISNAISIKYKLFSVGIDLDACSFEEAAKQYVELGICNNAINSQLRNELVWIEHRRWVVEKICQGWKRFENLEDCINGNTKDSINKRHICILRSRPEKKLFIETSMDRKKWDDADDSFLAELDEIDRMSVILHKSNVARAKNIKNLNPIRDNNLIEVRALIENEKNILQKYHLFISCIKDIYGGNISKVNLYYGIRDSFLDECNFLYPDRSRAIRKYIENFELLFNPILRSMEYKDWKANDEVLVDNIPFALTYHEKTHIVVPYKIGDIQSLFENVLAATIINPYKITYLILLDDIKELAKIKESFGYIKRFIEEKKLRAYVELVFVDKTKELYCDQVFMGNSLGQICDKRVKTIKIPYSDNLDELKVFLVKNRKGKKIFALEQNDSKLSKLLKMHDITNSIPVFSVDSKNAKLSTVYECESLIYINKRSDITLKDISAFGSEFIEDINLPEFLDIYELLWEDYLKNSDKWDRLGRYLITYSEQNDLLGSFNKEIISSKSESISCKFVLPSSCEGGLYKIIECLKESRIISKDFRITGYTTDTCEVYVNANAEVIEILNKIFANIYPLMADANTIYCSSHKKEIQIRYDNLIIRSLVLEESNSEIMLLRYLESLGLLRNLTIREDDSVSFTYSSVQTKHLLESWEKLVEVYIYHSIRNSGRYDDIANDVMVFNSVLEYGSHFDCIATNSFSTYYFKCINADKIDRSTLVKDISLLNKTGINPCLILISNNDNVELNKLIEKENKAFGNMIKLLSVSELCDIPELIR